MLCALALGASIAGVAVLFLSWRGTHGWKRFAAAAGWIVIGLSAWLWTRYAGIEFGLSYAAIAVAAVAWTFIAATRDAPRRARRPGQPYARAHRPSRAVVLRMLARMVVAIPLAGIASLLACVALVVPLHWADADRYVLAITAAPVVWAALSIWAGMTSRLLRTATAFALVAATAGVVLLAR